MLHRIFLCATVLGGATVSFAQAPIPPEIENEQILNIGKQPWHATLMPYANLTEALAAKRRQTPRIAVRAHA